MRPLLVPALVLVALAGCRGNPSGNEPADVTTSTTHAHAPIVRACPLGVPETRIAIEELPDRVVLAFTTSSDRVPALRSRVADQAAQSGPEKHEGPGHDGMHGASHGHGLRLWDMPASRAIVEEIPEGARLHVTPLDPAELGALRAALRGRVRALEDKDCP